MKLTKIALGVAVGIGGAAAANAADVAMFPYIVNSGSVTTIVSVIDRGDENTKRYNEYAEPVAGDAGKYLHWRLHYKTGRYLDNNKSCKSIDSYLSTRSNDIQTVDLSNWASDTRDYDDENYDGALYDPNLGVLFDDPSTNNQWQQDGYNYGLVTEALLGGTNQALRGLLFVHNGDDQTNDIGMTAGGTVKGEAMIFEYEGGAAWGYLAEANDGGNVDDAPDFSFTDHATGMSGNVPIVSFMPSAEFNTALIVTPVDETGQGMLAQGGDNLLGWNRLSVIVGLRTDDPATVRSDITVDEKLDDVGVAFDRDGNEVMGAVDQTVMCVGSVKVESMLTEAAKESLTNGGYGFLSINQASDPSEPGHAIVYKLEYSSPNQQIFPNNPNLGQTFVFSNGMKL